jgi:hypothetical protein
MFYVYNQDKENERGKHVARTVRKGTHMLLGGNPEGKGPLGTRRSWMDNIKMDHREMGWGGVDWIGLAEDKDQWRALVNAVMNVRLL